MTVHVPYPSHRTSYRPQLLCVTLQKKPEAWTAPLYFEEQNPLHCLSDYCSLRIRDLLITFWKGLNLRRPLLSHQKERSWNHSQRRTFCRNTGCISALSFLLFVSLLLHIKGKSCLSLNFNSGVRRSRRGTSQEEITFLYLTSRNQYVIFDFTPQRKMIWGFINTFVDMVTCYCIHTSNTRLYLCAV